MLLRSRALYRFLGLVAFGVPATVLACSAEVTPINGTGTPSASTTESSQPTPTTAPTTAPTTTTTDGGTDAGKDAAKPPTDIIGSAECTAYCAKMKTSCNKTCTPKFDCTIEKGQCAASTQKYLDCKTTTGKWYCGGDGFSIVSDCERDTSLCK